MSVTQPSINATRGIHKGTEGIIPKLNGVYLDSFLQQKIWLNFKCNKKTKRKTTRLK